MPSSPDHIREKLLTVRLKLLDLSKRNRLLNYRHNKSAIRVIDEQPRQVFDYLVKSAKPKPVGDFFCMLFISIEQYKASKVALSLFPLQNSPETFLGYSRIPSEGKSPFPPFCPPWKSFRALEMILEFVDYFIDSRIVRKSSH